MDSQSWLWTINSISECTQDSINCIYIYPLLMYKNNEPFKLIYTDENGKLESKTPSSSDITLAFSSFASSRTKTYAKAFKDLDTFDILTKKEFLAQIERSEYIAIQGIKELTRNFLHDIEYIENNYQSLPYIVQNLSKRAMNDISQEKILLAYSTNCILSIEKSRKVHVKKIEFVYAKDSINKIWLENVNYCCVSQRGLQKASISNSKIIMNSTESYQKKIEKINKSFSHSNFKKTLPLIKPQFRVSNAKLKKFMPMAEKKTDQSSITCFGNYCNREVVIFSMTRMKKVSARKYLLLSHNTIKACLMYLEFPLNEHEFSEKFMKVYRELLGNLPKDVLLKKNIIQLNRVNKNGKVSLCSVCYKIFLLAYSLEIAIINKI